MEKHCTECGTLLQEAHNCREYFDKMLAWDFEDFAGVGQVHHLTVLCYYLQHPSHYSVEGLKNTICILKNVVENNLTNKKLYQKESEIFSSSKRMWNVVGTPTNHGSYSQTIAWHITVSAVVKDGMAKYPRHVKEWAKSIYNDLKASGELE